MMTPKGPPWALTAFSLRLSLRGVPIPTGVPPSPWSEDRERRDLIKKMERERNRDGGAALGETGSEAVEVRRDDAGQRTMRSLRHSDKGPDDGRISLGCWTTCHRMGHVAETGSHGAQRLPSGVLVSHTQILCDGNRPCVSARILDLSKTQRFKC